MNPNMADEQAIRAAIARRATPMGVPAGGSPNPAITQSAPPAPMASMPPTMPTPTGPAPTAMPPQPDVKKTAVSNIQQMLNEETRNQMKGLVGQFIKYL